MSLTSGARLGTYEIVGVLGAGGMGEVYRARDTRLERDVAIKVLPDLFALDPARRARFDREARMLAALNHPNVAAIYGVEALAGVHALILEFVDGRTLADHLRAGPLPQEKALRCARQIADAMAAAHAQGIIHRDLKPANIALTRTGQVKVLDFGLAKAVDDAATVDEIATTVTRAGTRTGVVLGTAQYMSPEQARGLDVDKRTDIWAFGCVMFEMLTRRCAFDGRTTSDTLVAVLHREPDWSSLPAALPPRIEWLLRRCLEKDPDHRLHDIVDARLEIDDALENPAGSPADGPSRAGRAPARLGWAERAAWLGATLVLSAVAAVMSLRAVRRDIPPIDTHRYIATIMLPEGVQLARDEFPGRLALSPDGTRLAFVASDSNGRISLWVRPLESRVARSLPGTDGAAYPFWSPDSHFIAFMAQNKLKTIDSSGGDVNTLCDASFGSTGAWGRDDVILFTPTGNSPLYRVHASGGAPAPITTLDASAGDYQHSYPFFLPDGRHFLYSVIGSKQHGLTDARGVYVAALGQPGPGKPVVETTSNVQFANGHLIFLRSGALVAQPFDTDSLTVSGEPRSLVEQVQLVGVGGTGETGSFSVSQTGLLTYETGGFNRSQLTWIDRSGQIGATLGDKGEYADVALSPDDSHVAVSLMDAAVGTHDIWVFDVSRGLPERFTFDPADDFGPNWSRPDGDRIVFSSRRAGSIDLYEKPIKGSAAGERLVLHDPLGKFNARFSPDGRYLLYVCGGGIIARSDLCIMPLTGTRKPAPFLDSPFVETQGQFSPDGRWVAYTSSESSQEEVYITPFPAHDAKWRVSTAGGSRPRWNPKGGEIFYLAPDNTLMSSAVTLEAVPVISAAHALFQIHPRQLPRLDALSYDVAADGRRFLVNRAVDEPQATTLMLIVNWPR